MSIIDEIEQEWFAKNILRPMTMQERAAIHTAFVAGYRRGYEAGSFTALSIISESRAVDSEVVKQITDKGGQ